MFLDFKKFALPVLLLATGKLNAQLEVGIQAGPCQSQFFYTAASGAPDYDPYRAEFSDRTRFHASTFARLKKGYFTISGLLYYLNRETISQEWHSYASADYDPYGFPPTGQLSLDNRTVTAKLSGIYAAILPGIELSIGKGKIYLNAGYYFGFIATSSFSTTGWSKEYNAGLENSYTWTNEDSKNPLAGQDYGIMTSFGLNAPLSDVISIQVEFQGSYGQADLGASDFGEYRLGKINSSNLGLNFGFFYRFGSTKTQPE